MIWGAGEEGVDSPGDGEPVGDVEPVGDGEAVGNGEPVGDGEAVTDGDGEGDGDALGRVVAEDGGLLGRGERLWRGELTVTTGMAGCGPGTGDVDGMEAGWVAGTAGAAGAAADVGEATALGCTRAADERGVGPPSAKLTATDAAIKPAVTPAAVSGRHQRRPGDRPGGLAGPGEAMAPRAAPGSQPGAGCLSFAAARTSSAVGRRVGSLARQCPTSGRSPRGTSPRSGGP